MALNQRIKGVNAVDGLAALLGIAALAGVLWSPKLSNTVARATGSVKPVQISVDVRGVPAADPDRLLRDALQAGRTSIVIRNQPHGSVRLVQVQDITRKLVTLTPDGRVLTAVDPNRRIQGTLDARFILDGEATVSGSGVVMAGTNLKIGTPVELEGPQYRVNGTVSGVEIQ
ncbi:DUF4330 domain-containing protein [Synechococcus sp. HK01-R]|uniref:DUF4330 domain-containing protein n=1 Tax=Synechococcus sp. HK01-R TaxID=2751171 RepID=UPI001624345A|nr:DUF4330 domain-containing protein [Synechococcus sp. HK01-R]QNG26603.1 DUF4330 domain-containing protein [Synechococcus sp. HK01-R]